MGQPKRGRCSPPGLGQLRDGDLGRREFEGTHPAIWGRRRRFADTSRRAWGPIPGVEMEWIPSLQFSVLEAGQPSPDWQSRSWQVPVWGQAFQELLPLALVLAVRAAGLVSEWKRPLRQAQEQVSISERLSRSEPQHMRMSGRVRRK